MKTLTLIAATALASAILAPATFAQPPGAPAPAGATRPNALVELPAKNAIKLTVTTPAWKDGGDIPFENTQYRNNDFPGLTWTPGPAGTKSYAIIMQDTDGARAGAPILHWTLYNIPGNVTSLPASMASSANPPGSQYGPNYRGPNQSYLGPRTPPGAKHHYHLQVFALDTTIAQDPNTVFDGLEAAMKDHVLASGEVIGLGQADPNAPPPAPRGGAAPAPAAK
jgi:para-nitrobenzyl esterase